MTPIRLIVAGSREIADYALVSRLLDQVKSPIECVVSGWARGVDRMGAHWAKERGIPVVVFKADWSRYGRSAGVIRNGWMADAASHLLLIWDGESPGSANMLATAKRKGLVIAQIVVGRSAGSIRDAETEQENR